jgi:hypothetical protein
VSGEVEQPQKREEAVKVLGEILGHMELPATLDAKDADDGAISIAVGLTEALPGVQTGRRSPFSDALQYLVNKRVNPPGTPRRHVLVGIGAHPAPRAPKAPKQPAQAGNGAPAAAEAPSPRAKPAVEPKAQRAAPAMPQKAKEEDERTLEVELSKPFAREVERMAAASAALGRYYVLMGLGAEDRARVLKAAQGADGVTVKADGEGRNRRLVFTPAKPVPLPRKLLPMDMDDDELE